MRRIIKYTIGIFGLLINCWIVFVNAKQYYKPEIITENEITYNNDVYKQLQFLKKALRNGAGKDMQAVFPEGFIFINALYGLSWSEFIDSMSKQSKIYKEGIEELTFAIQQTQTDEAKYIFDETLPLKYGAFYMGWSTYLIGAKLKVQRPEERLPKDVELFSKNCRMIQNAIDQQELPYLESYLNNTWPADGIIAVSSLHLYNTYLNGNMQKSVTSWMDKVKQNLDTKHGLIPHKVSAVTGESLQGVRGCSQSLILNFIKNIDLEFAKDQFAKYKSLFVDTRVGLSGIREYPKGVFGLGDVDSGPVIWDIGASASVVGQRTMGLYGEYDLYNELRNNIEGFGFGRSTSSGKQYLFGQMPMMDAFFAWSNALETNEYKSNYSNRIPWKFHIVSLVILLIYLLIFIKI